MTKEICKFAAVFALSIVAVACTGNSHTTSASKGVKVCDFDVLVFADYIDSSGKKKFDFEALETWTPEGTHDYAVKSSLLIQSASVEVLDKKKTIKIIDLKLMAAGDQLTQLNDNEELKNYLRSLGEIKPHFSLRFLLKPKNKKTCVKNVEIFAG